MVNQPDTRGGWETPQAYAWGSSSDLTTDPEMGGFAGLADGNPFAFGGVESNTVENFELNGNQAAFNSPALATRNYGDVGYSDFAGVLGSALAADQYEYPSFYATAASIVEGF
jgi:hypothetical protein